MSNDSPSPLRDLSVRCYAAIFLSRLKTELDTAAPKDERFTEVGKSIQIDINTLVRGDNTLKKYINAAAKSAPLFKVVESLEKKLHSHVRKHIGESGNIAVDSIISNYLWPAIKESLNDSDPLAPIQCYADSKCLQIDPGEHIRDWVSLSLVTQRWEQLKRQIIDCIGLLQEKITTNVFAHKVDECLLEQLENLEAVKRHTRDADFSGRKKLDKKQNHTKVNRKLSEVTTALSKLKRSAQEHDVPVGENDSNDTQKGLIEYCVNSMDIVLQKGASQWPLNVLLECDRFGISINDVAECLRDDSNHGGVQMHEFGEPDSESQFNAARMLTEYMASCFVSSRSLNHSTRRTEFTDALDRLFKPFAGKVSIYWECNAGSAVHLAEYADIEDVDPFRSPKTEYVAVVFTDKGGRETLVQKGKYLKPQSIPPLGRKVNDLADNIEPCDKYAPDVVKDFRALVEDLKGFEQLKEWWPNKHNDDLIWRVMSSLTSLILIGPPPGDTDKLQWSAKGVYDEAQSRIPTIDADLSKWDFVGRRSMRKLWRNIGSRRTRSGPLCPCPWKVRSNQKLRKWQRTNRAV